MVLELVTLCHCLAVIVSVLPDNVTKIVALGKFVVILLYLFYRHVTNIVAKFFLQVAVICPTK